MPYRSKAQHRLFRVLEAQGKLPKGTASEWAHHTPSMKKLPEHVKKHKTKQAEMTPQAPPNYRLALGQVNTCGNCLNYEPGAGNCNKYKVPVANDHVCDAYNQNKTMVSQIRLKNNLSRPVKLDNSLSGPSPAMDLTSGVSDLKPPEIKAAAAFNNAQAPPMTNPIRPIAGVGFGGSGQKPATLGMAGNRPQPGGNTVPPGAIIQWLNSQAQQLMQSRRQQPQPAQPQPQPAPTAKQAGFFGLLADEINTLSLKQANTPLPKPAPAPKSPTSPTPAPPPAPKATQPAAGGNLNDPFHNAGSSDGDDKKDPFHSVVPDPVNNKPDPYQNVGTTDETPSTFANPSPGNGGQPPKAAPVATTSGGQSTQPAAPAQPQQAQAQPQQQPASQAEQLATAAVTAPIQQAQDANRPLTDAERIAIGAVNAPKDKAYEEIYKTLKPEDIPSNPHAQLALNNRPKETNYKVQDPQEQPPSYDSIRARMQALGNRQSAPLPVPQSVDGEPLGPEAGLLPSAGRFLKGFPAALGRAAGEYYDMAKGAIMPEPTTTPLPKPSGPVERVDPTPVSQQKVPAPNIETPGPQFISNKIQEPTAAGAAQTPYIDKLEHKGKAPLTDGMHSSEFKRLQDQIGFTDQTQKRFNDNLPYDPDNRSREYVSNLINSPVSLKGGLNAQRAADHLANQFKDQAGREYTNNMFQHAQPPKMYQLDPKEDTAYYSPRTKSMGMSDNYNNIDTYMHELTHGLGARSGSSAKRVPYVNNNLPGREGQTYDPDAEYPAMVAGHLARLKTNQRAHEMGQSTQLPAQLAGALGSANPFASTVGALAGNRGAATLTMPGGNIIHPQERHKLKDNYSRSLGTAMGAANNNNYFTPQSAKDTANIYPTLEAALPSMMLEKQNRHRPSLLALEKQAIGARAKRLARFEAAASNKQRAEAIEAAANANRKISQPLSFWDKLRGVKNKEKLVDIPETTVPIRSLANQDIRQRADEIAKMQARPGGYGNEYRKSFEDLPPLSEVANAYERQTNSLYKKFAKPTSQAYSDRVQELLRMHGDPKIFGPGTGLHAKLWFRGDKPYKNMTDAMRAAMDRLAATGRHANVRNDGIPNVLADFIPLNKEMENPNLAYAGFSSTQLRPRRATLQTPEQIAAKESPVWYSGYPQVSANYIQQTMRPGVSQGYLIEAPVDKLKEIGPHSPNFHPHKAVDTRGFTPEAVNALPNWKGETTPPHYESVFTAKSDDVLSTPISRLFKLLPSGSDFQRVK